MVSVDSFRIKITKSIDNKQYKISFSRESNERYFYLYFNSMFIEFNYSEKTKRTLLF